MNEKNRIIVAVGIFSLLVSGCRTQPNVAERSIIEGNRVIAELQTRNDQYNYLLSEFRADITAIGESASRGQGSIEDAIYFFNEYNRRVQQLIADYNHLQSQAGSTKETVGNTLDNTGGSVPD